MLELEEPEGLVSPSSSVGLWDPSLQTGDPPALGSPRTDPPSPTEEERDPLELSPAPRSPGDSSLLPEAVSGTPLDTGSAAAPSDHPDGKRPPSWEEKWLLMGTPHPEAPPDLTGQEFTFLEVRGWQHQPLVRPWGSLTKTLLCGWGFTLWASCPRRARLRIRGSLVPSWGSAGAGAGADPSPVP